MPMPISRPVVISAAKIMPQCVANTVPPLNFGAIAAARAVPHPGNTSPARPTLAEMADSIQFALYGASSNSLSVREILEHACEQLGVEPKGGFIKQATRCYEQIYTGTDASVCDNPHFSGVSPAQRAEPEVCTGGSLTERSDRSASAREAPPKASAREAPPTAAPPMASPPRPLSARSPRLLRHWASMPMSPSRASEPADLHVIHV